MKAIFIDAKNQQVSYVNNKGQLEDLYLTLGVNMVEIGTYLDNFDTLYVDEEGLINGTDYGFSLNGREYMGNGLLYGTNPQDPSSNGPVVSKIEDLQVKFFKLVPAI